MQLGVSTDRTDLSVAELTGWATAVHLDLVTAVLQAVEPPLHPFASAEVLEVILY